MSTLQNAIRAALSAEREFRASALAAGFKSHWDFSPSDCDAATVLVLPAWQAKRAADAALRKVLDEQRVLLTIRRKNFPTHQGTAEKISALDAGRAC